MRHTDVAETGALNRAQRKAGKGDQDEIGFSVVEERKGLICSL